MGAVGVRTVGGLTSLAAALLSGNLSASAPTPPVHRPPAPAAAGWAFPGLAANAPAADPAAVRDRLAAALGARALGGPRALVVDASSGSVLLDDRSGTPTVPASTLKTVTAAAALTTFKADDRITTRVGWTGPAPAAATGTTATGGTLWLVGGGDPTLTAAAGPDDAYPAPARLSDLAAQVRRAGITRVTRVVGDGSLFTGPGVAPGWRDSYRTTGNVTPVSALEVDGGREHPGATTARASDPTRAAAEAFATALRRTGVAVDGVGTGATPSGALTVASVASAPVPVLVERMLANSDDDQAEALGRLVARARGLPTTFAGAAQALGDTLRRLGVPADGLSLVDASGLSPQNRLAPKTLVALLRTAVLPGHENLRPVVSGLPVAGFNGTLTMRYHSDAGRAGAGDVRAKTGSLNEVTALAGQVVDADGRLLLFAFVAPVGNSDASSAALDRAATALAGCGCSTGARPPTG